MTAAWVTTGTSAAPTPRIVKKANKIQPDVPRHGCGSLAVVLWALEAASQQ